MSDEDFQRICQANGFGAAARGEVPVIAPGMLRALLEAVAAEEREACARLCEDLSDEYQRTEGRKYPELKSDAETGAGRCADAIRQRGQP